LHLFFTFFFFDNKLTSNNMMHRVMSGNLSFIIRKTVKYIDQYENSSWCVNGFKK